MIITENLLSKVEENSDDLLDFHQGVEKEGLRVRGDKYASKEVHSDKLGHKLTHPYITTDYAENLLEFVSPVFTTNEELLNFIADIQAFALKHMGDECIWPASMPCYLAGDKEIPIASFGESNVGKLKTLYRMGLGYRYGRSMQSIAGMHFNFSISRSLIAKLHKEVKPESDLTEFTNALYFKMIRNFRRHSWLLLYLFGSSPVVDEKFLEGKVHSLDKLGKDTYGKKYATSLRMGGLGYTSTAQEDISICYNQLNTYVKTLETARKRPYAPYEKIGVKVGDEYRQLNANLLQIDNEFYSPLRPKRTARSGESALQALHNHGVEYIEVRLLDLNPFVPEGINDEEVRFLQAFLTFCMLDGSPEISSRECDEITSNFKLVVEDGRNPDANLNFEDKRVPVSSAAGELLKRIELFVKSNEKIAAYYGDGVSSQLEKIEKPELLFSARVLSMVDDKTSFVDAMFELAKKHKEDLLKRPLEREQSWLELVKKSLEEEKDIAGQDVDDFDSFLQKYFEKIKIKDYP